MNKNQNINLSGVEECGLHRRTPYGITNVRETVFSVARFSGMCKFQGDDYTYLPETDELIRNDVLRWKKNSLAKCCDIEKRARH